jgi:hypothetical protein
VADGAGNVQRRGIDRDDAIHQRCQGRNVGEVLEDGRLYPMRRGRFMVMILQAVQHRSLRTQSRHESIDGDVPARMIASARPDNADPLPPLAHQPLLPFPAQPIVRPQIRTSRRSKP